MKGKLRASIKEINLALTLPTGQAFRWKKRSASDIWFGVINGLAFDLKQDAEKESITWTLLNSVSQNGVKRRKQFNTQDIEDILTDYFQLRHSLEDLYCIWSKCDENFAAKATKFPGVRVLRQNPCENLFSFICSSNNNIQRISQMVEALSKNYGDYLFSDEEFGEIHAFPCVNQLSSEPSLESTLRELKFGYRAKFIAQTASIIVSKCDTNPDAWLNQLREDVTYEEARKELMLLPGVGAKVADCVCLMSLDKPSAIPVDTHVWQIATTNYLLHLKKTKSLTDKTYNEVSNFFRDKFGTHAGWAHSVLFCADLRQFKS